MKFINNIISNIKYYLKAYPHFGYAFENPFNIFGNKIIRRIFCFPVIKFNCYPIKYNNNFANALFGLYFVGLSWKDKYGEPHYEDDPFIQLNLFGYCFKIKFTCPVSDKYCTIESYWESMLEYYNKIINNESPNLYDILENNIWIDSKGNSFSNTLFLTNFGITQYIIDKHKSKK